MEGEPIRVLMVDDHELMREALKASGLKTKRAAVEAGLWLLVKQERQKGIRRLRGRLTWQGSLDELRRAR